MSSRRPRRTRTASSSSATRSTRSARSRSPISGRCPARCARSSLVASRELLLTERGARRARASSGTSSRASRGMLEKMAEGIPVEGMESLLPALVDRLVTARRLPARGRRRRARRSRSAPSRARSRSATRTASSSRRRGAPRPPAPRRPIDLGAGDFLTLPAAARGRPRPRRRVVDAQRLRFGTGGCRGRGLLTDIDVALEAAAADPRAGRRRCRRSRATSTAPPRMSASCSRTAGGSSSRHPEPDSSSARAMCSPSGASRRARSTTVTAGARARRRPCRAVACSSAASRSPDAKLAVLTESEFYGRTIGGDQRVVKKLASRRKNVVDPLQLKAGDYVVHATHGIGKFVELTQREVSSGGRNAGQERARVPRARVRAVQARLPGRQALRADRSARPALAVRRRRGAGAVEDGRQRLGAGEGHGAQGRARHRRRARQALLGAHGGEGPRLRSRHAVAARARRGVPVRRDARPAADDRRDQGRHGEADPDGPAAVGRRRLRQDRGRRARRVQGDPGRQAGRDARADDAARQAAPRDVHRALRRLPGQGQGALAVPDRQAGARRARRPHRRHRRHGDRHAPHPHREGASSRTSAS